jgi:hypothetical protein
MVVKNSQPLPGLKPPLIQPIAQCYTTELHNNTIDLVVCGGDTRHKNKYHIYPNIR